MATYDEMARYVMDWANRSTDVLSFSTVRQCLIYANDEAMRTLRIAPMEFTGTYDPSQLNVERSRIPIPNDAIEFIELRKRDTRGDSADSVIVSDQYIVAEAKSDIRSLYGNNVSLYSDYAYAREGTDFVIYPRLEEEDVWEIYYYRRFEDPHERVEINVANAVAQLLVSAEPDNTNYLSEAESDPGLDHLDPTNSAHEDLYHPIRAAMLGYAVYWEADENYAENDEVAFRGTIYRANNDIDASADNVNPVDDTTNWTNTGTTYDISMIIYGSLEANWLRDQNEKVLLFGALHHVFDYLDEQDQSVKYKAKFEQEMDKLNYEDKQRMVMGGNLNINFYSRLI